MIGLCAFVLLLATLAPLVAFYLLLFAAPPAALALLYGDIGLSLVAPFLALLALWGFSAAPPALLRPFLPAFFLGFLAMAASLVLMTGVVLRFIGAMVGIFTGAFDGAGLARDVIALLVLQHGLWPGLGQALAEYRYAPPSSSLWGRDRGRPWR